MDNELESRLIASPAEPADLKGRVWTETIKIWRIAFPGILARTASFGRLVVTQSFIGHISALDLAAYALVETITVRFAIGILLGMSSATETLCGQAFGAKQYHMMGIYLQRSWIIDLVTATVLLPFFIFATPLYKLLGQEDDIADAAESISLWFIPVIYNSVFGNTIQMYLQAQQKNMIIGCLSLFSFVLNILLSWIAVYKFNWGVPGAMSSMIIGSWAVIFGEFIYIFGGWCPDTWKGFSKAAFYDMLPIMKLSISSGFMLCLQLWYTAVLVLIAGFAQNATVSISAFSICLNISAWQLMICLAFLGSTGVRVSNELGRGDAKAAKFAAKVSFGISFSIGLLSFILCLAFGHEIPYLFTSDAEVAEAASELSVLLAFSMLLNSTQPVLSGKCSFSYLILSVLMLHGLTPTSMISRWIISLFHGNGVAVGSGSQARVAIVNVCSYYVVGVPIGVLLAYVANLEVKGIWIGMICGVVIQQCVLAYITWNIDWDDEVNKASRRLDKFFLKSAENSDAHSG